MRDGKRKKGVGERDAEGEEGNGKEGRGGVGVMDFGKVVKSRPTVISKSRRLCSTVTQSAEFF